MILPISRIPNLEFRRRGRDRVVAGVAGGLADALGISDGFVRAAFVTLTMVWGLGVLVYLGMWLMEMDRVEDVDPVEVAPHQAVGLAIAFAGFLLLLGAAGWWPSNALVLTVGALSFGTAALTDRNMQGPLAALVDPTVERPGRLRMLVGIGLLIGGLAVFSVNVGPIYEIGPVLLAVALTGIGILVAFGPWVTRLARDLGTERRERIRQEERAEMAAHLHDSVLQTLALIQRSDDPARMSILARHQESELRDWLYGNAPLDGVDLVSTAMRDAARRIEADHQVPIDVVVVGDHPLNETTKALLGAASEAMVNAAKHSGAERVSLYFEADRDELVVYVTDQGKGFEPAGVAGDRRGIVESIKARVERAGGAVAIVSEPGEGTEVVLRMPVSTG
ncbi:MAG TPA: PspC domain-containing protein [Acidimicrobiia bacterium]|nr:PspC domain-containing protein [Acidimicrobiia bacterium]